jgi:hypothetical protein
MVNRLDGYPIRISGVLVQPCDIVGLEPAYQFSHGYTQRTVIGTTVRLANGTSFLATETIAEIGVLLQGHDDGARPYTGGGDTDFFDPSEA